MEDPRKNNEAQRLVNNLADLFEIVPPESRTEAEEELRSAGDSPEDIGRRLEQLATDILRQPSANRNLLTARVQPRRANAEISRRTATADARRSSWRSRRRVVSSIAASAALGLLGWFMLERTEMAHTLHHTLEAFRGRARDDQLKMRDLGRPRAHRPVPTRQAPSPEQNAAPAAAPVEEPAQGPLEHAGASRGQPALVPVLAPPSNIPTGYVVTADNVEANRALVSPGVEWAVRHGMRMTIVEPRTVRPPRAYREATQEHAPGVRLVPDGMSLEKYVAGQPFPHIDSNDPQAALKIMWNYEYRFFATDDVGVDKFEVDVGRTGRGIDRHLEFDDFRRLYFNGRQYIDPRPKLPSEDGVRYREQLGRIETPIDLQGVGGLSVRHTDASIADKTWIYLPALRRVRTRAPTDRSVAMFGQDTDIDSYFGYNGGVGAMQWRFLGEQAVLACLHARNHPIKWDDSTGLLFDDVWELRTAYVVEGIPRLPQYAYGKRVLYIDKEAWVVHYSDLYDQDGELWKTLINMHSMQKARGRGKAVYAPDDEQIILRASVTGDIQSMQVTRTAYESETDTDGAWVFNQGYDDGQFQLGHTAAGH